jgi:hemoglobin/transferrin/lactoferrin receptor protein
MKMIFRVFLAAVLLVPSLCFSQILSVFDEDNGLPIEYATIISNNPRVVTTTNRKGQADISAFNGAEHIEIRMIGYTTLVTNYAELEFDRWRAFLKSDNLSLETVVVSATRTFEPKSDIPVKVTTISPREVKLQNPQTAADLLGTTGEVFIQKSQQGGGSPMIRGFATNRVLLAVDGVRMNTAIFRSGNVQNVISIDPFTIENTEIIFGPGSVLYGSDAIGGVMSFYTKDAELSIDDKPLFGANATVRGASANREFTGHVDVNMGWRKWALRMSITTSNYGDLTMGKQGPDEYLRNWYVKRINNTDSIVANDDPRLQVPSGFSVNSGLAKIRFRPNQRWDFNYTFNYSATTNYDRYDRLIETRNGTPRNAEWYYGPQIWMFNLFNMTHVAAGGIYDEMNVRLAYQHFEESRNDRRLNSTNLRQRTELVDAYSANLDFIKAVGRQTFFYGAEAIFNEVNSNGKEKDITTGVTNPAAARYPNSTWASYAAYLTYQIKFSEKLLLQAGARYNQFLLHANFSNNADFYPLPFETARINTGALTGSLGMDYRPVKDLTIGAHVSTGFRSPNVDDIGKVFDSEPGAVVVPNPDLQAEYATNLEVDIAKRFKNAFKVDVAGFYTILQNAMVRLPYTLSGQDSITYDGEQSQVQAIQNASQATVYGVQVGLDVNLPAGFDIRSKFSWQRGEERLADGSTARLRHAAPWFGLTGLRYNYKLLTVDLYANYSGEVSFDNLPPSEQAKPHIYAVDENGNPYSPRWYSLNVKALIRISNQFNVSAGVENITNQRYRTYSSGQVAPGVNVILAINASF